MRTVTVPPPRPTFPMPWLKVAVVTGRHAYVQISGSESDEELHELAKRTAALLGESPETPGFAFQKCEPSGEPAWEEVS